MAENINTGDSERITREYFDSLLVEMRHIDSVEPSTEFTVYGKTFATPVMMAALSHLDRTRTKGMVEAAKGFRAAGALAWSGMGDYTELEEMRAAGAEVIKIIKPHQDNREIFKKLEHAEKVGCLGVGMDIDHQFGGKNKWYEAGGLPMAPKSLNEIREFVKATKLPFIIKGVLSEQDTYKCLDAGVQGILVSHHHGMVDYALPPLRILPKILQIVKKQMPVFVDCGITRGMDAFKALALGADAVCLGRVILGPLAEEGAEGVRKLIETITHELKWAMAVTGSPQIRRIDPKVLWER
ncbi:MAG: alpha-hydroxy-acid oxidizing protein [Treponema sp.]|jgi:isopentenyl diphosphate isomerase/L-lactate dehydrogenase-like FMN-dependent dehydrogenase|nr:alpha-hydroxy-acid oxidizing protein [Treponema sp.]